MSERRWTPDELEAALRDCRVAWPATPDLADPVRRRLAARPTSRRRVRAWMLGALAAVAGATAAIEPARSAVLELLGLRAVRIERRAPDPSPRPFGVELDLGRPATLEEAARATGLEVTPPSELKDPPRVWLSQSPAGIVSLVYRRPRILVQVLDGDLDRPIIEKVAGTGVDIEPVRGGYFLSGAPHGVGYVGPGGRPVVDDQRLAGNTLIVERDGALVRVEGRLGRRRALAVADTIDVAGR